MHFSAITKVSLLYFFHHTSYVLCDGIYSKEANEMKFGESPFKMMKVNMLWKKSSKRIKDKESLADLYADLKIHDKYEIELKKYKAANMDADGQKEAMVLENYQRLMAAYLPEHKKVDSTEMSNEIPQADEGENEIEDKETEFEDPKLQAMWQRARAGGFSDEDLSKLEQEFQHQQLKIKEFDFMHQELTANLEDNTVDSNVQDTKPTAEEILRRKEDLKKQKRNVKDGYMTLEHKTNQFASSEPAFSDSRIQALWSMAQKTNWTAEEMDGFLEELKHFETRISKHSYYMTELENVKTGKKAESSDRAGKQQFYTERISDMKTKIEKLHSELRHHVKRALVHKEL